MPGRTIRAWTAAAVLAVAAFACASGSTGPTAPSSNDPGAGFPAGTLSFTALPIALSDVLWVTPLGNLNPPGHILPTDHIYFYTTRTGLPVNGSTPKAPFRAPADGTVLLILGGVGIESKVFIRTHSTFQYYLDHLILTAPIARGSVIKAGDILGTTGLAYAVDLGVINESLTLPFLVPSRYIGDTLHADAPLKYFVEPLRSQLYGLVQRIGPDRDGTIVYDVANRLSGNWFGPDTTPLSFAYDTYDPNRVLISLGSGTIQGVFGIGAANPAPRDVSVTTGLVRYSLYSGSTGPRPSDTSQAGWMLVQMTDNTHIQWETFPITTTPAPTAFVTPRSAAR